MFRWIWPYMGYWEMINKEEEVESLSQKIVKMAVVAGLQPQGRHELYLPELSGAWVRPNSSVSS